jgi:hypothetical protein
MWGMQTSLIIAAVLLLVTAAAGLQLARSVPPAPEEQSRGDRPSHA